MSDDIGWSCPACHARDDDSCVTGKGRPRRNHARRVLLYVLDSLLRWQAHRLRPDDRLRLAVSLLAPDGVDFDNDPSRPARPPDPGPERAEPDWPLLWRRLIAVSTVLLAARKTLDRPDGGLLLDDLVGWLRAAERQVDDTYNLCCTAANLDDLVVPAGADQTALTELISVHRAALVDAGLRARVRPPEDDEVAWTVAYHQPHGGFIATVDRPAGDHTQPEEIRGAASTPLAAADLVAQWHTGTAAVTVAFDPPVPEQPALATLGAESDLTAGFGGADRVLNARGPRYQETREACAQARERLRGVRIDDYLERRAQLLNTTDPQILGARNLDVAVDGYGGDHSAWFYSACWVRTELVVDTRMPWGRFGGHRPEVPGTIATALAGDVDLDRFLTEFFGGCPVDLRQISAWAGPLYQLGADGTHRTHTARMLDLPWLCATVGASPVPLEFRLVSLCAADSGNPLSWSSPENHHQRVRLLAGLIRRGIVDGELVVDDPARPRYTTRLVCRYLPAPWLVRNPQLTTQVNAVYESRYPGALERIGIPVDVGTDTDQWIDWLT